MPNDWNTTALCNKVGKASLTVAKTVVGSLNSMAKAMYLQRNGQKWVCSSLEERCNTLTGHQGGDCLPQIPK
jgi:hypothetical protein